MDVLIILIIIGIVLYFYFNPTVLQNILQQIQNQAAQDVTIAPYIPPTTTEPPVHCKGEWSTWGPKCTSYNDNYHKCTDTYNANDKNITSRVYNITQKNNSTGNKCLYNDKYIETDYCNVATSKPLKSIKECSKPKPTYKPVLTCIPEDYYGTDRLSGEGKCIVMNKKYNVPDDINNSQRDENINVLAKVQELNPKYKINNFLDIALTLKPIDLNKLSECNQCSTEEDRKKALITNLPKISYNTTLKPCNNCIDVDLNGFNYITTYKPYKECKDICYGKCDTDYTTTELSNMCLY